MIVFLRFKEEKMLRIEKVAGKDVLMESEIPFLKLFKKGKVREVYELGEYLLIVATDRISAFDVVMKTGVPSKGSISRSSLLSGSNSSAKTVSAPIL